MKGYSKEDQEKLNEIAKEKYNMQYPCDLYGRFPWICERKGEDWNNKMKTLSLSKSSLGTFVFEVLKRNGNITSFFVLGQAVFPSVRLTMEDRDDMVAQFRYALNPPPVVHLN